MKPKEVDILGTIYSITYVDNPALVDLYKRKSLWGQIDYWTRTIRIYDNGRSDADIWDSLIHEIIHGFAEILKIGILTNESNHEALGLIAIAFREILFRNGWIKK